MLKTIILVITRSYSGEIRHLIACFGVVFQKYALSITKGSAITSFLVDGSLCIVEQQSFWSVNKFMLGTGSHIEYLVSYSGRGSIHVGLGDKYKYNSTSSDGYALTLMVSNGCIWIRDQFFNSQLYFESLHLGDQEYGKLYFSKIGCSKIRVGWEMNRGIQGEYIVNDVPNTPLHVFMTSWTGVFFSRIHSVRISCLEDNNDPSICLLL